MVGIYARLSVKNSSDTENESAIENQIEICKQHIKENRDLYLAEVYVDNGFSGRNFNRPAFQKMLYDISIGKITSVLVKDLSRFGRNVVEVGYYLEQYFPSNNIRFISINDNIDTAQKKEASTLELQVVLKNMLHELYTIDASKKIKYVKRQQASNGKFIGSTPPYGYKKTKDDHHTLQIDHETAHIVCTIFEWFVNGMSVYKICKTLNERNVKTPTQYRKMKNPKNKNNVSMAWQPKTVKQILSSEVYIGTLTQCRTSHKRNKCDGIVIKHTHTPIICETTFSKAQQRLQEIFIQNEHISWKEKTNRIDPLQGKIQCGTCQKSYRLQKSGNYICGTNRAYIGNYCTNQTKIAETTLHSILSQWISLYFSTLHETPLHQLQTERILQNIKKKIEEIDTQIKSEEALRKQRFESYAKNCITKEMYLAFKKKSDALLEKNQNHHAQLLHEQALHSKSLGTENRDETILKKEWIYSLVGRVICNENGVITLEFSIKNDFI